jgi:hypothetical protein
MATTTEFLKKKSGNRELWDCLAIEEKKDDQSSSKNERITEDKDDRKFEGKNDRTLKD